MIRIGALILVVMFICGCVSSQGVIKLSPDTYMVRVEDHGGIFAFNRGKLKGIAIQEANEFAEKEGKTAIPISMHNHPVGILGDWAAVEYQFRVVAENDDEFRRTHLQEGPDFVIERKDVFDANINIDTKHESETNSDMYTELMKLNDLKEKGILSENEFNTQKQKLLGNY